MWEILILGVKTAVESSSYLILIVCVCLCMHLQVHECQIFSAPIHSLLGGAPRKVSFPSMAKSEY